MKLDNKYTRLPWLIQELNHDIEPYQQYDTSHPTSTFAELVLETSTFRKLRTRCQNFSFSLENSSLGCYPRILHKPSFEATMINWLHTHVAFCHIPSHQTWPVRHSTCVAVRWLLVTKARRRCLYSVTIDFDFPPRRCEHICMARNERHSRQFIRRKWPKIDTSLYSKSRLPCSSILPVLQCYAVHACLNDTKMTFIPNTGSRVIFARHLSS